MRNPRIDVSLPQSGACTTPSLHEWPAWLLAVILVWHLLVWVALPSATYEMLPLDAAELLGWGKEWQLGYYKHPPLGPWLGEWVFQLSGQLPESLYVLAQFCVVLTLYYVWRTARLVLNAEAAIAATLLLEVSYFHTVLTPNFNMNSLQLPIWAAMGFHFLRALQGASKHWIAAAIWSAAALLTKYSGALLLLVFASVLTIDARARSEWRNPWLWGGAAIGLLLISPHLAWLLEHWRLPVAYLQRFEAQGSKNWSAHVVEPIRFAVGALAGMVLCAVVAATLLGRGGREVSIDSRTRQWITVLCFGPLVLAMLYGAISGSRLKSTWAFPFFNLFGIWLLTSARFQWKPERARWFGSALLILMLGLSIGHVGYKTRSSPSKTVFDGTSLAAEVDKAWQQRFGSPLRIVAGDHILTAIVSTYAPSRPSMLIEGRFDYSPWISESRLKAEGAAVICESDDGCPADRLNVSGEPIELQIQQRVFRLWFLPPANFSP